MNLKWNQIGVAFLIGLLLGTLVGSPSLHRKFKKSWDKRPHHERMLDRFASKLDLSPKQKNEMAPILQAKRVRVEALFTEMAPKFEQIRTETNSDIRKLLNPDQLEKFEALDAKMKERFKKRFPKHR